MLSTYLNIADLGVEVEHGSDLNGSSEPDVVHMQTPGTAFAFKEMSCTLVSNGYEYLMSKWRILPKTWALAQPNSNACLMMNPPKILLNLNVNFLSSQFLLIPQHVLFEFWNVYVPVSVLRLANNQVFQLGVFKPDRVGRLYPGW